jgi:hypothetical protein
VEEVEAGEGVVLPLYPLLLVLIHPHCQRVVVEEAAEAAEECPLLSPLHPLPLLPVVVEEAAAAVEGVEHHHPEVEEVEAEAEAEEDFPLLLLLPQLLPLVFRL